MLKDAITLANEGPVVIRYPKGVAVLMQQMLALDLQLANC